MPKLESLHNEWLRFAEVDLKTATHLFDSRPELITPICFHAQQAAEKYIKALLVSKDVMFPKTHDLSSLMDIVNEPDLPFEYEALDRLSRFAVSARYPEDIGLELEDAQMAIQIAQTVKQYVLGKIVC